MRSRESLRLISKAFFFDIFSCMSFIFKRDYSHDYFAWLHAYEQINFDKKQNLDKLQAKILQDKNAAFACFFAMSVNHKNYLMQKIVLESKISKYALLFAEKVDNADIKSLQEIVLASKNLKYISRFGCFVDKSDKKRIEKIIIREKNPRFAHMCLKHMKGANINKLKPIILTSKKPRYLYELAKHSTSKSEITKIENAIIASKCFTYIRLFADKIKQANVDKLEQFVIDNGSPEQIKKFAKYVRRSKMKKFLLVA
jgi:hypothetical protein